jgi:hypothetical protein
MNPETKLTVEQLKAICQKHGIPYVSHERITYGFSHEVHRLNDDLVIKVFNTESPKKFETELVILGSDLPFLKPKLVASGDSTLIGRSYIIMGYIPGISLGRVWHKATDVQREVLISDIANTLKIINKIDPALLPDDSDKTWEERLKSSGHKLVRKLLNKKIIDEVKAKRILEVIDDKSASLVGSKLYAVYWDVHLDNFIVNDNFELQAIIDLENVELTALDYPLFAIEKMMTEPHKYLAEEDEKYADVKDYAKLKTWYKKYYPEIFDFKDQKTRVELYQLIDALHLSVDWSHVPELGKQLNQLIYE